MTEPRTLQTVDGLALEAELAPATPARGAMVLCHPHPQFGGSMRSIVIGALFDAMPGQGVECLRFNFRGVERSEGAWAGGDGERHDVEAAVASLADEVGADVPLVLTGWSFGADMALSTSHRRVDAWLAVAPPLRFTAGDEVAHDERPKLVALAEHDEVRSPQEVVELTRSWTSTETELVPGASHFFVGRTDRLVTLAVGYVDRLVASRER